MLLFPGWWSGAGTGIIALGWIGRWTATGRPSVGTALDAPAAVLALAVGSGVAVSAMPVVSAGRAWGILLGLAVYYTLVNATPDVRERAVGGLAVFGVVVSAAGLLGTDWSIAPALTPGPARVYEHLSSFVDRLPAVALARALEVTNPREVGGVLALILPVAAVRVWHGRPHPGRGSGLRVAGAGAACLAMSGTLLLSQSLSAISGVLIGFWLSVVVADRARRRWWLAGGGLCGALGLAAAWPRLGALASLRDSTAMSGQPAPGTAHVAFGIAARLELWPRALAMVHDTPYTGVGLGLFPWVMDRFYSGFILGPERHAHNFLLQVAVDLGLPGLVALVWLLAAFAAQLRAVVLGAADRAVRVTGLGLGAGLLAFLVFGTIDVVPLGARPALALWVVLGVGVAAVPRPAPPRAGAPAAGGGGGWRRIMALLLALALLAPVAWDGPRHNAGRFLAYRALLPVAGAPHDVAALRMAGTHLAPAAHRGPPSGGPLRWPLGWSHSGTWYLLGTLAAHQGQSDVALDALWRGVFADSEAPLWRYALSEALFRPARSTDWPALQRVYAQWTTRYPQRAEWYTASAIAACAGEGDRAAALARLAHGRAAGATPAILLEAYGARLTGGVGC